MQDLTWVEISRSALTQNIKQFRELIGDNRILCPCVKANAYGHGLAETGKIFVEAGADWLAVNSLYEAKTLRDAGVKVPLYILGYVPLQDLKEIPELEDCRIVVYNREVIKELGNIGKEVRVHIKIETGNNRQGVMAENVVDFAKYIKSFDNIILEGVATHFANIEDTTDHSYAERQLRRFEEAIAKLEAAEFDLPVKHCANSAATILFPKTHFTMVRVGLSTYGMWPSNETYVSYMKKVGGTFKLKPAFTWKTKVAQVRTIPSGEYIGYGCTYKTTRDTRLAILPIGYYDGYDRGVAGGHVLIRGQRAPIRGRICMNIIMVDISDIPGVELEEEVVLIGKDGDEEVTAEMFGGWAGTINYEVTTRVNERIPRIVVD